LTHKISFILDINTVTKTCTCKLNHIHKLTCTYTFNLTINLFFNPKFYLRVDT